MAEFIFLQSQNRCGLWAHRSAFLVSMRGSKCCARRSGSCTTAISKGECILMTASGLKKKKLRSSMWYCHWSLQSNSRLLGSSPQMKLLSKNPLQCEQGFGWSCVLSEPTLHRFKGFYQRSFLLLSFLTCWDLNLNSMVFDFIHRFAEQNLLKLNCPNLSI